MTVRRCPTCKGERILFRSPIRHPECLFYEANSDTEVHSVRCETCHGEGYVDSDGRPARWKIQRL